MAEEKRENRFKVLRLSGDMLISMLESATSPERPRWRLEGIPDGLRYEKASYEIYSDSIIVLVSHPSFDVVPLCENYPRLEPVAFRVDDEPIFVPVESRRMMSNRDAILAALNSLKVQCGGTLDDRLRWSAGDLATDLAEKLGAAS